MALIGPDGEPIGLRGHQDESLRDSRTGIEEMLLHTLRAATAIAGRKIRISEAPQPIHPEYSG